MMPNSPTLRVAFLRPEGPRSATESERLTKAGLEQQRISETGEIHLAEWQSRLSDVEATVVLGQDLAAKDLACAYFSGPSRVALAARLAPVLAYIPIELMHLAARGSPVKEERLAALTVLGQFYLAEKDASYWDVDIEKTLAIASAEPDTDIRHHALFAKVKGTPAEAVTELAEALSEDLEPDFRKRLEILRHVAEKRAGEVAALESLRPGLPGLAEGRLALPTYIVEGIDEIVHLFSNVAVLIGRRGVEVDGETVTEVVELRAKELDAGILYLAHVASKIGCAYFTGSDRVVVATGSAHVLKYFPVDLAKNVALHEENPEWRALGLRALAWSASHRMLPGPAIDPEIRAIIAAALADPDSMVRDAAASAVVLLRGELAQA